MEKTFKEKVHICASLAQSKAEEIRKGLELFEVSLDRELLRVIVGKIEKDLSELIK